MRSEILFVDLQWLRSTKIILAPSFILDVYAYQFSLCMNTDVGQRLWKSLTKLCSNVDHYLEYGSRSLNHNVKSALVLSTF